jgi:hypothetical protein
MAQEEGIGLAFRMYRRVGTFPSLLGFNHTYRIRKRAFISLTSDYLPKPIEPRDRPGGSICPIIGT